MFARWLLISFSYGAGENETNEKSVRISECTLWTSVEGPSESCPDCEPKKEQSAFNLRKHEPS